MNPFENIENRLSKIERILKSLKPEEEKKNRFVTLPEFAAYSRMSINTIYSKLTRGPGIPGAFKNGPKMWLVDLDEYDKYLVSKKAEYQS